MGVRIKICGITSIEDAASAVNAGADALGLMFHRSSPRWISLDAASAIVAWVPPTVATVGVFVDPEADFVREAIARTGLNTLQFHGNEAPEFCAQFGLKTIKAFRLRDRAALDGVRAHPRSAWLLDSYVPGVPGGSGQVFNWDLAVEAKRWGNPVFLAGGLTPENVRDAVRRVAPFGVDVSSGVEASPGRKDPVRLRRFIGEARAGANELATALGER